MTRVEYMNSLANKLRRLPREDYDTAMQYFQEYFEEAGSENEQQAIEDLGSPDMAADQIVMNMAIKNAESPKKNVKRGFSTVWVGILAVFAAPIALPLAFAFGAVIIALVITVGALLFALATVAFSMIMVSVVGCIGGVFLLFSTPANGIATIGVGLICMGFSIFATVGAIRFGQWFLNFVTKKIGDIIRKRGRKNEK